MISVTYANGSLATNQVFTLYKTKKKSILFCAKVELRNTGDVNITYQELVIGQKSQSRIA